MASDIISVVHHSHDESLKSLREAVYASLLEEFVPSLIKEVVGHLPSETYLVIL